MTSDLIFLEFLVLLYLLFVLKDKNMFAEAADIVHSFSYVLISLSKMKIKLFLLLSLLSLAKV